MSEKLRAALDTIDELLCDKDVRFSQSLWNVLTALRGPDTCHDPVDDRKLATTSVVRKVAFPRAAEKGAGGAFYEDDSPSHQAIRRELIRQKSLPRHFLSHAEAAFGVLGVEF